jgi:hypothetical protein
MDIANELLDSDPPVLSVFGIPPALIVPGTRLVKEGVYVYGCPVCKKTFRYNDAYEPICTGPSENRDDHAPEVMRFLRREPRMVLV